MSRLNSRNACHHLVCIFCFPVSYQNIYIHTHTELFAAICLTWNKRSRRASYNLKDKKILGCKRKEETQNRRKLGTEALHHLNVIKYFTGDQINKYEMEGACKGQKKNIYSILIKKPKGRRFLARSQHSGEDSIYMKLEQNRICGMWEEDADSRYHPDLGKRWSDVRLWMCWWNTLGSVKCWRFE